VYGDVGVGKTHVLREACAAAGYVIQEPELLTIPGGRFDGHDNIRNAFACREIAFGGGGRPPPPPRICVVIRHIEDATGICRGFKRFLGTLLKEGRRRPLVMTATFPTERNKREWLAKKSPYAGVELPPLSVTHIRALVREAVPDCPWEILSGVAERCRGDVRLALTQCQFWRCQSDDEEEEEEEEEEHFDADDPGFVNLMIMRDHYEKKRHRRRRWTSDRRRGDPVGDMLRLFQDGVSLQERWDIVCSHNDGALDAYVAENWPRAQPTLDTAADVAGWISEGDVVARARGVSQAWILQPYARWAGVVLPTHQTGYRARLTTGGRWGAPTRVALPTAFIKAGPARKRRETWVALRGRADIHMRLAPDRDVLRHRLERWMAEPDPSSAPWLPLIEGVDLDAVLELLGLKDAYKKRVSAADRRRVTQVRKRKSEGFKKRRRRRAKPKPRPKPKPKTRKRKRVEKAPPKRKTKKRKTSKGCDIRRYFS